MNRLKAVSLIEVIVYLALFGMIFITIIQFFLAMQQFNERTSLRNGIQFETVFVSSHFDLSAESADSIIVAESIFESSNGVITLETPAGTDIEYSLIDGRIQVDRNGVANFITSNRVEVTNLRFEEVLTPFDTNIGFRLIMDLNNSANPTITESITTSFIVDN